MATETMTSALFYIAGVVALLATLMVIRARSAAHGALYLVVSLLAVAVVFFTLGAPFIGALEIIVYAGAIMVLFVFVIMMLNVPPSRRIRAGFWLSPRAWFGPTLLALVLAAELAYILVAGLPGGTGVGVLGAPDAATGPKGVALSLFGPYMLAVELASFLLLAGLVGAYHLGYRVARGEEECA